jgi:cobalt/nickel transport system ATP-binding protein
VSLEPGHKHPHPHDAIVVRDLHYHYPDGTEALRSVTLRVREGDSLGIVGPNGAGKSTLILHLNGILRPHGGTVEVGGVPVVPANVREVRRRVGLVFQNPDDQLFMPTVFDDVAFGPLNMGLPADEVRRRVLESLAEVGCKHLAERAPYHLSGGEKRAVAIATVLSMHPQVLVLDEPSAGLDPRQRRALITLLNQLRPTKVIVSHDLDLVKETCARVAILDAGAIVAEGEAAALLADRTMLTRVFPEL